MQASWSINKFCEDRDAWQEVLEQTVEANKAKTLGEVRSRVYGAYIGAWQATWLALEVPATCLENVALVIANVAGSLFSLIGLVFTLPKSVQDKLDQCSLLHAWTCTNRALAQAAATCVALPMWCLNAPLLVIGRLFNPAVRMEARMEEPGRITWGDVRIRVSPASATDGVIACMMNGIPRAAAPGTPQPVRTPSRAH